jgi:crotonobetaine/carnitine-CoA ligase
MTETGSIVCRDTSEPPTHDVIGEPIPGRAIRVENPDTGEPAATGEPGQLWILGRPGVDLFAGYLDDEATTARVFRETPDGTWFATGDLVTADAGGTLRFVGRVDDVIKVSGENVSLAEVEAAASEAPGVLEAAVVAKRDPVLDAVPIDYVVDRDAEASPSADELAEWATHNLTPAARPREWHLLDDLPRSSVGKVRRFQLPT